MGSRPSFDKFQTVEAYDPNTSSSLSRSESFMNEKIVPLYTEDCERIRRITRQMVERDELAFAEFYECYCDRLYRYLLVLTRGNENIARDLLLGTMTKVMQRIREFQSEQHLWNWLAAIARNAFLDTLRRRQREPQLVPLLPEDGPEIQMPASADEEAPLFDALDRGLGELDSEERTLIEAFYFKGGSHQSMAKDQNTTPKAVESKLARVRQKLRAALIRHLRHEND